MTFTGYPHNKDSGMSWFGSIPSHWTIRPLAAVTKLIQTGPFGSQLHASDYVDDGVPIINPSHIEGGKIRASRKHTLRYEKASELGRHRLLEGDAVAARRGDLGRCAIVDNDSVGYICGTGSILIRLDGNLLIPKYFQMSFSSCANRERLLQISEGSTMDNLNAGMVARLRMCLPPVEEQREITEFLNDHCASIDALIAKQERLIATLREDRTATITHAVTKGLDPDVAVADSGVEWLGDIPCHWTALRIKNVIQSVAAGTSVNAAPWPAEAEDIGVHKTSCVSAGSFNPAENKAVLDDDELNRVTCPVRADSLIVNRANTPLLVGSAGYVTSDLRNIYLSDKLWQVRFRGALARFIYYWTQTEQYRSQIAAMCVGASSSMQNLAIVDFRNIALALPPIDEQAAIVRFLVDRTSKIDKLVDKSSAVIDALNEYCSALITEAITGKIDVREAVA